jgi:hypothetical protein
MSRKEYTVEEVQSYYPDLDNVAHKRIADQANNNLHKGREWLKEKRAEGWFNPPPKVESELERPRSHWLVRLGRFLRII